MKKTINQLLVIMLATVAVIISCKKSNVVPAAPVVSSINPATGLAGVSITISGSNFSASAGDNTVKFNGTTATVTSAKHQFVGGNRTIRRKHGCNFGYYTGRDSNRAGIHVFNGTYNSYYQPNNCYGRGGNHHYRHQFR